MGRGTVKDREKARKAVETNKVERARLDNTFPGCIGMFPDCKEYKEEMPIEQRPECRLCPYK